MKIGENFRNHCYRKSMIQLHHRYLGATSKT